MKRMGQRNFLVIANGTAEIPRSYVFDVNAAKQIKKTDS
jgi:hypothetical protein